MFQDLDKTLENILIDSGAPSEILGADVSFETPDKNFKPTTPDSAINLFLYEVAENRQLRTSEPIVEPTGNSFIKRQPPLRIHCSYLVTAWKDGVTGWNKVQAEHQLLGEAFFWFNRFPTIPEKFFFGSLVGQPYPPPTLVAQWDVAKNQGEFWNSLGIPPRPYFNLIVTIAMDLKQSIFEYPVTTSITNYQQRAVADSTEILIEIGSRVILPPKRLAVGNDSVRGIVGGTLVRVNNAAPFSVGDVVTHNDRARATITQIARNDLTLSNALTNLAVGNRLRIANITPSQDTFRVNDLTGLTPGGPVLLSGEDAASAGTTVTERAVIQSIAGDGFVTLAPTPPRTFAYNMNVPLANAPTLKGFAAGTWVRLADPFGTQLGTTTTDIEGRFRFAGLEAGHYSLKVRAPGFSEATINVTVPSATGNYDVQL